MRRPLDRVAHRRRAPHQRVYGGADDGALGHRRRAAPRPPAAATRDPAGGGRVGETEGLLHHMAQVGSALARLAPGGDGEGEGEGDDDDGDGGGAGAPAPAAARDAATRAVEAAAAPAPSAAGAASPLLVAMRRGSSAVAHGLAGRAPTRWRPRSRGASSNCCCTRGCRARRSACLSTSSHSTSSSPSTGRAAARLRPQLRRTLMLARHAPASKRWAPRLRAFARLLGEYDPTAAGGESLYLCLFANLAPLAADVEPASAVANNVTADADGEGVPAQAVPLAAARDALRSALGSLPPPALDRLWVSGFPRSSTARSSSSAAPTPPPAPPAASAARRGARTRRRPRRARRPSSARGSSVRRASGRRDWAATLRIDVPAEDALSAAAPAAAPPQPVAPETKKPRGSVGPRLKKTAAAAAAAAAPRRAVAARRRRSRASRRRRRTARQGECAEGEEGGGRR